MRLKLSKVFLPLVVVLSASILTLSAARADQSAIQEQVLAFIEDALPLDLSKYTIELKSHSTLDTSTIPGSTSIPNSRVVDNVKYSLISSESTVDVICKVENNIVRYCQIYPMNGSVIRDKQYTNLLDAVRSLLDKYQAYNKLDSTNLKSMLDNVDVTKDVTNTVNDTKFTVTNNNFAGKELTTFKWTLTLNGADYTSLEVCFEKDGTFQSLIDTRAIYKIGDTSINISREQAISIALENLRSYSYEMPGQYMVSDFNVTEDGIKAELATSTKIYELRPYWDIRMPLNQTYPGNVQGITAFIWANSGEIISYSNIAFGGVDNSETPSPEATSSPEATNSSSPNIGIIIAIALAAISLTVASVIIVKKK